MAQTILLLGVFFDSATKPNAPLATSNLSTALKEEHDTPICCIGGITTDNCQPLINAGTDMLAVIGDIFSQTSSQYIQQQCQAFTQKFIP